MATCESNTLIDFPMTSQNQNLTQKHPWSADCGDGNYRNPVLYADYSDPDVVRVGDDYWMTASSFSHVPGLPILHSRDLVNWTLVNHALPALVPQEHFSLPRPGQGVWAPAIRHHASKFWIFYPDPDFGIYFVTADDPRGRWSEPHMVKAGKGLIDPCPLWDDDGQVYLIHGWAKSRSGINNLLTLHKLSSDATRVSDEGKIIIDGNKMPGWNTIEGPKLHKHNGWYYVFAPAGGVAEGYQAVFRATDIYGPYEARNVMDKGETKTNGPHQGAWVDTPLGEHWFFHFQELPAYGRVVHLQPMRWLADGWPVIGEDPDNDGKGQPVSVYRKPVLPSQPISVPATSDDFSGPTLGLQWQWQANPRPEWSSLTEKQGHLRLRCLPCAVEKNLWIAPGILMQKFPAPEFVVTVRLEISAATDGAMAGLIVFGYDYSWLGLRREHGAVKLLKVKCRDAQNGAAEQIIHCSSVLGSVVFLRVRVTAGAIACFESSVDGVIFNRVGEPFQALSSKWVGGKVGLFASTTSNATLADVADFSQFVVGV